MTDIADELRVLEEALWRPETRFDRAFMDRLLAPGFHEFGRSGGRHDRESTLASPYRPLVARLPLAHFVVRQLAEDVVLVTYVSEVGSGDTVERANCSSIWRLTQVGWQLAFHQGTPTD